MNIELNTGASVYEHTPLPLSTGGTSLASVLFKQATVISEPQDYTYIVPSAGSKVLCNHCNRTVITLVGDCLVTIDRHDSQPHKTVIPLSDLGLMRMPTQQAKM